MEPEKSPEERTVWTIGHSNHLLEEFLDLLGQHRIELLLDVRSSPYSGYASQFNTEAIKGPLHARAIGYLFLGSLLGGRVDDGQFYDGQGHVRYDLLAASPEFQQGIQRVLSEIETSRAALMCGEEDPTECHRRLLVGRVLATRGVRVVHIRGDGRAESEQQLAAEQWLRRTKGQLTLFDTEDPDEWKSTRSVSPRGAQRSSSRRSSEPESDG
jgi:uncharacterized protein (DUF488 family)